jgi:hypothetical protein
MGTLNKLKGANGKDALLDKLYHAMQNQNLSMGPLNKGTTRKYALLDPVTNWATKALKK